MNHFTNKEGFNGINSQRTWRFLAVQPKANHHPVGAYFTSYDKSEHGLAKKLFVPISKLAFVFSFTPPTALLSIPGGRGRLGKIFYSPVDYTVEEQHQIHARETEIG